MELREIQVKYKRREMKKMPKVNSSKEAEEYLRKVLKEIPEAQYSEIAVALYLNRANRILGHKIISRGGIAGTVMDIRIILSVALKCLATRIIIAHNHPSGNEQPSEADKVMTKKIREAGKIVEIKLLDSLILTDEECFSFANEGLI